MAKSLLALAAAAAFVLFCGGICDAPSLGKKSATEETASREANEIKRQKRDEMAPEKKKHREAHKSDKSDKNENATKLDAPLVVPSPTPSGTTTAVINNSIARAQRRNLEEKIQVLEDELRDDKEREKTVQKRVLKKFSDSFASHVKEAMNELMDELRQEYPMQFLLGKGGPEAYLRFREAINTGKRYYETEKELQRLLTESLLTEDLERKKKIKVLEDELRDDKERAKTLLEAVLREFSHSFASHVKEAMNELMDELRQDDPSQQMV